ncbi:MAG: hypothetical protein KJ058_15480, partial [Thermoanaerobaculia bacterium]|nr:hypothetical protein [Thermoanaerobaculia bacterium]
MSRRRGLGLHAVAPAAAVSAVALTLLSWAVAHGAAPWRGIAGAAVAVAGLALALPGVRRALAAAPDEERDRALLSAALDE